jgi:hypothetical protein
MTFTQKPIRFLLLLTLLLFFGSFVQDGILFRTELPNPTPTPSILPTPNLTGTERTKNSLSNPKRTLQLSKKLIFSEIDQKLRNHRKQFAFCLLQNKTLYATRIQMTLSWQGSGLLKEIQLNPDPGIEVKNCIEEVVHGWSLKSHPGMQPFSFQTVLIPSH